jgi:hypothetical protein
MNHGAVLGHDAVDEVKVSGDAAQFVEGPPSDEQNRDASPAGRGNRVANGRFQGVVTGEGAVVVQGDH